MKKLSWIVGASAVVMTAIACGGSSESDGSGSSGGSAGQAGSGGSGGSSGGGSGGTTGGSGGSSGGSGECVHGNRCDTEGETCSEGGCCPCQNICEDGQWVALGCPGCAPPICEDQAPTDGEPCDECNVPAEGCRYDDCGGAGRLFASCEDGTWKVETGPCETPACCMSDGECPSPTSICISTICKDPTTTGCWRDDQCASGERCSGAFVCPCDADCAHGDQIGTCVPDDPACCLGNDGCRPNEICVAGVCKEQPPSGGDCWRDAECFGGVCNGAMVCPCLTNCILPDTPGTCGDAN